MTYLFLVLQFMSVFVVRRIVVFIINFLRGLYLNFVVNFAHFVKSYFDLLCVAKRAIHDSSTLYDSNICMIQDRHGGLVVRAFAL